MNATLLRRDTRTSASSAAFRFVPAPSATRPRSDMERARASASSSRPAGASKPRISRTTRMTCFSPFLGGTMRSTRSVARMRPTRSLLRMALKARSAATSLATRTFAARRVPNRSLADRSTTSITVISRSSTKTFTNGVVHARRHVPVDGAHVVARLVRAHLAEREALPLEARSVGPRQLLVGEPRRVDLDDAEGREKLLRNHGRRTPGPLGHLDDLEHALHDLLARDLLGVGLVREHERGGGARPARSPSRPPA